MNSMMTVSKTHVPVTVEETVSASAQLLQPMLRPAMRQVPASPGVHPKSAVSRCSKFI